MNETAWIQASLVQDMNIVNGSLIPVEAGRTMEVLIDANKLELESMTNYFAIKAFDYFNQESTVSNVVKVQFDLKPSRIRTLKATLLQDGHTFEITFTATGEDMMNGTGKTNYRIGCVSTRFGLLHALAYYAQHNCDFIMTLTTRFGLLRADSNNF